MEERDENRSGRVYGEEIMPYPKNPETVILKNKFYPKGLTEKDIWDHYQRVKTELLKQTVQRDLFVYIMTDKGPIVKRKGQDTEFIRLNPSNYDDVITGRTISIHSTMRQYEDIGIIDIDTDDFRWAKQACMDVVEISDDALPFLSRVTVRYTGKTGFHVICHFGKKIKIDGIRFLLRKFLLESELGKKYTIEAKRRPGIPNLDLAPNKYRGGFITLHALSIMGLRCMEVDPWKVKDFNQQKAIIK